MTSHVSALTNLWLHAGPGYREPAANPLNGGAG